VSLVPCHQNQILNITVFFAVFFFNAELDYLERQEFFSPWRTDQLYPQIIFVTDGWLLVAVKLP
jgi:hypothetical protein